MTPIVYRGELVAVVGCESCHVIAVDLDDEDLRIVLLMCVFIANERGRQDPALLSDRAESWARALCAEARLSRPR